jgi:hypothetical protein
MAGRKADDWVEKKVDSWVAWKAVGTEHQRVVSRVYLRAAWWDVTTAVY